MNYDRNYINDIYDRIDILDYQIEILNRNYSRINSHNNFYSAYSTLYDNPIFSYPHNTFSNRFNTNTDRFNSRSNRLRRDNLYPYNISSVARANAARANAARDNLERSNTSRANISRANISRANISRSNISRANVATANVATANVPTDNVPFDENFATSFAQRIHNILSNINDDHIPTNIHIETHGQIIVSHKSVSNNTNIELFIEEENIDDETNIDDDIPRNRCVICMENIDNNSIVRRLNKCNHYFHINCIDKWFETKITCPTCRQDIRELQNNEDT
jgi:hypothetical protein